MVRVNLSVYSDFECSFFFGAKAAYVYILQEVVLLCSFYLHIPTRRWKLFAGSSGFPISPTKLSLYKRKILGVENFSFFSI